MSDKSVSVVMPVHNGERYLAKAVESVLEQSLSPCEIIIVDDASTDGTAALIEQMRDPRVRHIRLPRNVGPALARNTGIRQALGQFIAMLDSDDIAEPNRLAMQVSQLQRFTNLACIGSWARYIDSQGKPFGKVLRMETDSAVLPSLMLFQNRLFGSSIMFRRDRTPAGLYPDLRLGEDYAFVVSMLQFGSISNVPASLIRVRRDGTSLTYARPSLWKKSFANILSAQLETFGIKFTPRELELHQHIGRKLLEPSLELLNECENWLLRLSSHNRHRQAYDIQVFEKVLAGEWFELCKFSASIGPPAWTAFWSSHLARYAPPSMYQQARLLAKCALHRGRPFEDVPRVP